MPENAESILDSTKKALGLSFDYTDFDLEIITHINSAFMSLRQLGVGPVEGFVITDASKTWLDFSSDIVLLAGVRTYMFLKVRLVFDPPATSFAIESMERQIAEAEWRLNVAAEAITPPTDPTI